MTGLTPGNSYNLSFAIASESGCCSIAQVSFLSGSSTASQNFSALNSGQYWTAWQIVQMTFLATASSVTLQFTNLVNSQDGGLDLGLDNVSVTDAVAATPLPAALPLFATGLGALGVLGWRRKRKKAALAA